MDVKDNKKRSAKNKSTRGPNPMARNNDDKHADQIKRLENKYNKLNSDFALLLDKLKLDRETIEIEIWLLRKELTKLRDEAKEKNRLLGPLLKIVTDKNSTSSTESLSRELTLDELESQDHPHDLQWGIVDLTKQVAAKDHLLLPVRQESGKIEKLNVKYRLQQTEDLSESRETCQGECGDRKNEVIHLSSRELEHHCFPADIYSYFAVADYFENRIPTVPFATVLCICCFQILFLWLFVMDVINFNDKKNIIPVPPGVGVAVRLSQILALLLSCWNQDEIRASINVLALGYNREKLRHIYGRNTRWKWYLSAAMRFLLGFLSLTITFFLVVNSESVRDVMLDFAAITFVSELDDGAFLLAHWGYMGKNLQELTCKIKKTPIYHSLPHSQRPRKVPRLVSLLVIIIIISGSWVYISCKQANGEYVDQTIFVQFGDDFSPAIGALSGLYELELDDSHDGMRITYEYMTDSSERARFSYCSPHSTWIFNYGENLEEADNNCRSKARSSETENFDITKTSSITWYVLDEDLLLEFPLQHFFVFGQNDYYGKTCYSSTDCGDRFFCQEDGNAKEDRMCVCKGGLFGLNCMFPEPCQTLEIDPTDENGFYGTRLWSRKYSSLQEDGKSCPIQVNGKPVFIGHKSIAGIFDIMIFIGRRWILTDSKNIEDYDEPSDGSRRKIAEFLANNFHGYFSNYTFHFVSEPVDVGTPTDSASPAGLQWFRMETSGTQGVRLRSKKKIWQGKIAIEAKLFCAVCHNETNPCFFGASCRSDHTCQCTTGSSGTLCQIPPDGNGLCDSFFNTPEFAFDGGDCCQETCISTTQYTCGHGMIENSAGILAYGFIGYPNCGNPKFKSKLSGSTTLYEIIERGSVRCGSNLQRGFVELTDGVYSGFEVDMCKSVAAAALGDPEAIEIVDASVGNDVFVDLSDGKFDVLVKRVTYTAERDIYQSDANVGFSFIPTPYLFDGVRFGGIPPFSECANKLDIESYECTGLKICVPGGTTWQQVTESLFPGFMVVAFDSPQGSIDGFQAGLCNVIAGEVTAITEFEIRARGFTGPEYKLGDNIYSKEPLAAVTREDDRVWFKFVSWIFEVLIQAEESGITKVTADRLAPTDVFGEQFSYMFKNAVAANGNYGEIYQKNLQDMIPRSSLNNINTGDSGLIYAFPFGSIENKGPDPILGGTIETIRKRGVLHCGIIKVSGFAVFDPESGTWSGFGVDMCRGIAAALFNGSPNVNFLPLTYSDRFRALADGVVDVLSAGTTHTLTREVREVSTGQGFDFTPTIFYDGLGFGGYPPYATCADHLIFDNTTLSAECLHTRICVPLGTTLLEAMQGPLNIPGVNIFVTSTQEQSYEKLISGECNTIAGETIDIAELTIRGKGYPLEEYYLVSTRKLTKEPNAVVSRSDDIQFSTFLRWAVFGFFYAAEEGITREEPFGMPRNIFWFGNTLTGMWGHMIEAVGNYNEMFARNFEGILVQGGQNNLNNKNGPQFSAMPGIIVH